MATTNQAELVRRLVDVRTRTRAAIAASIFDGRLAAATSDPDSDPDWSEVVGAEMDTFRTELTAIAREALDAGIPAKAIVAAGTGRYDLALSLIPA